MVAEISPLVVIVGETASGKTALGIELAQKFNGEIICADSRTIYKGMDIGTAKPTLAEQKAAKHHLIDIIEPDETYSAAQFKKDANELIEDITSRGKLPIIVGGTGLYVDAVLFDYDFAPAGAPRDLQNPRHLDRTEPKQNQTLRQNTLLIGVQRDRRDLEQRIALRVEKMVAEGFVDEVRLLGEKYGLNSEALTGIGYRFFAEHIKGEITLDEAKQKFVRGDMSLAKRQRTWFKRPVYQESIHWINNGDDAVDLATTFLSKFSD
jgi:tRNA dimethylallyltransferase